MTHRKCAPPRPNQVAADENRSRYDRPKQHEPSQIPEGINHAALIFSDDAIREKRCEVVRRALQEIAALRRLNFHRTGKSNVTPAKDYLRTERALLIGG